MGLSLEAKGLTLSIGNKTLIRNVSFSVQGPGLMLVSGENGIGKTTFLKSILQRDSPALEIKPTSARIGYLGHDLGLYSSLSIRENLEFFGDLVTGSSLKPEVSELMKTFRLNHKSSDPIYTLSRGQKQKVAIMRTLICNPDIILLDEPFTGLDLEGKNNLTEILNFWSKKSMILVVLHEEAGNLEINGNLEFSKNGVRFYA